MTLIPYVLSVLLQTLPLSVSFCVDVDPLVMGYTVQLDAQTAVDVGMPTAASCKNFVGGATTMGIPFSVSVSTVGVHTVSIVGYNLTGNSPAASLTFPIGPAPGKPANGRVTK